MESKTLKNQVSKFQCALELKRKPVGIKFLFTKEDYDKEKVKEPYSRMTYCVMVKLATSGYSIKVTLDNFACMSSARTLGFTELDDRFLSGIHYNSIGLYEDLAISKNLAQNITVCKHKPYGMLIQSLESFEVNPDIVIIVSEPYNIMRIVQGYSYKYGCQASFKMTGNQAICSECTAYPFESNDINVSLMCAGTRHMAGWDEGEMAVGFPFNKWTSILDGLYATLNLTETNEKKQTINNKQIALNEKFVDVVMDNNYYTGMYRTGTNK